LEQRIAWCQLPGVTVSKQFVNNFVQALAAVLAGNAIYFLLLPFLPASARHRPFHIDLGLVVDFWFCLVVFGIIKAFSGRKRHPKVGRQ